MQSVDGWKKMAALARSITERVNTSGELAVSDVLKLAKDVAHAEHDITTALGYVCKGVKGEGPHVKKESAKPKAAPAPKPTKAKRAKAPKKPKAPKHATPKTKAAKPAAVKKKPSRKR